MADNFLKIITNTLNMNDKLRHVLGRALFALGPYIMIGVIIACVIGLFILSYYILLWGFLIGFILWAYALIKHYLFSKQPVKKTKGRIIDHEKHK